MPSSRPWLEALLTGEVPQASGASTSNTTPTVPALVPDPQGPEALGDTPTAFDTIGATTEGGNDSYVTPEKGWRERFMDDMVRLGEPKTAGETLGEYIKEPSKIVTDFAGEAERLGGIVNLGWKHHLGTISEAEVEELTELVRLDQIKAERGSTPGSKIVSGIGQSLMFGAGFGVGRAAGQYAVKKGAQKLGMKLVTEASEKAAKAAAKEMGEKVAKAAVRSTGQKVAETVATGAGVAAALELGPRALGYEGGFFTAETYRQMGVLETLQVNEANELMVYLDANSKSFADAQVPGVISGMVEIVSEMSGALIMAPAKKLLGPAMRLLGGKYADKWLASNPAKSYKDFIAFTRKFGFHGLAEEYSEEVLADLLRATGIGGMKEGRDPNAVHDALLPGWENFFITMGIIAGQGGVMFGAKRTLDILGGKDPKELSPEDVAKLVEKYRKRPGGAEEDFSGPIPHPDDDMGKPFSRTEPSTEELQDQSGQSEALPSATEGSSPPSGAAPPTLDDPVPLGEDGANGPASEEVLDMPSGAPAEGEERQDMPGVPPEVRTEPSSEEIHAATGPDSGESGAQADTGQDAGGSQEATGPVGPEVEALRSKQAPGEPPIQEVPLDSPKLGEARAATARRVAKLGGAEIIFVERPDGEAIPGFNAVSVRKGVIAIDVNSKAGVSEAGHELVHNTAAVLGVGVEELLGIASRQDAEGFREAMKTARASYVGAFMDEGLSRRQATAKWRAMTKGARREEFNAYHMEALIHQVDLWGSAEGQKHLLEAMNESPGLVRAVLDALIRMAKKLGIKLSTSQERAVKRLRKMVKDTDSPGQHINAGTIRASLAFRELLSLVKEKQAAAPTPTKTPATAPSTPATPQASTARTWDETEVIRGARRRKEPSTLIDYVVLLGGIDLRGLPKNKNEAGDFWERLRRKEHTGRYPSGMLHGPDSKAKGGGWRPDRMVSLLEQEGFTLEGTDDLLERMENELAGTPTLHPDVEQDVNAELEEARQAEQEAYEGEDPPEDYDPSDEFDRPDWMYHAGYHGGPHEVEEFDTDFVGTGEGNQAYGWGLYFASKKSVAEHYKKMLGANRLSYDGRSPDSHWTASSYAAGNGDFETVAFWEAVDTIQRLGGSNAALKNLDKQSKWQDKRIEPEVINGLAVEASDELRDEARNLKRVFKRSIEYITSKEIKPSLVGRGYGYKVELAPKESDYLLWDEPLSEQSEAVKKALGITDAVQGQYTALRRGIEKANRRRNGLESSRAGDAYPERYDEGIRKALAESRDLNRQLVELGSDPSTKAATHYGDRVEELGSQKAASQALLASGVRGIKYLDGASRGRGEGSFNYVIFDSKDIEITGRFHAGKRRVDHLNEKQLSLFPSEGEHAGDNPSADKDLIALLTRNTQGMEAMPFLTGKGGVIRVGDSVEAVVRDYVEKRLPAFDFVGKKVQTEKDAALLFATLRSPFTERVSMIVTGSDGAVKQSGIISVGVIGSAPVPHPMKFIGRDPKGARDVMDREHVASVAPMFTPIPGDTVWIAHNHPGGNPKPSDDDIKVYGKLMLHLRDYHQGVRFRGIITNGKRYSAFEEDIRHASAMLHSYGTYSAPAKFEAIPFHTKKSVLDYGDMFQVVNSIVTDKSAVLSITMDNRGSIHAVKSWPEAPTPSQLSAYMLDVGSSGAVLATESISQYNAIRAVIGRHNGLLVDVMRVGGGKVRSRLREELGHAFPKLGGTGEGTGARSSRVRERAPRFHSAPKEGTKGFEAMVRKMHPDLKNEDESPKVVYHGTDAKGFTSFGIPGWFSDHPKEASAYSSYGDLIYGEKARRRAREKYKKVSGADQLDGKRVFYPAYLSDIPAGFTGVAATDVQGVVRIGKSGPIEVFSDLVVEELSYETHDGEPSVRVVAGSSTAYEELTKESREYLGRQFPDPFAGVGGRVYPVYLTISNPVRLSPFKANLLARRFSDDAYIQGEIAKYKEQGYDGIVTQSDEASMFEDTREAFGGIPEQWLPFSPSQIKSAIGNRGTFDPAQDDIRYHASKKEEEPTSPAPPFFSALERGIERLQQKKFKPKDLDGLVRNNAKMFPGITEEELIWVDWDGLLNGRASITKEEVLDWLRAHQIEVVEKRYGGSTTTPRSAGVILREEFGLSQADASQDQRAWALAKQREEMDAEPDNPQYAQSDLQLPGGRDYEELVFKLPEQNKGLSDIYQEAQRRVDALVAAYAPPDGVTEEEYDEEIRVAKAEAATALSNTKAAGGTESAFASYHFEEDANTIGWVRWKKRWTSTGLRTVHIEEIQSDWAKAFRKPIEKLEKRKKKILKNLAGRDDDPEQNAEVLKIDAEIARLYKDPSGGVDKAEMARLRSELSRAYQAADEATRQVTYARSAALDGSGLDVDPGAMARAKAAGYASPGVQAAYLAEANADREARDIRNRLRQMLDDEDRGIPDAPFIRGRWRTLVLKRMVKWAADNGYDAVSWTTGEQQAERNNQQLAKAVESHEWTSDAGASGAMVARADARVDEWKAKVKDARRRSAFFKDAAAKLSAERREDAEATPGEEYSEANRSLGRRWAQQDELYRESNKNLRIHSNDLRIAEAARAGLELLDGNTRVTLHSPTSSDPLMLFVNRETGVVDKAKRESGGGYGLDQLRNKELSEIIGKDEAKKILSTPEGKGGRLTVGGQGFVTLYDKQMPKVTDQLGKRFKTKTVMGEIGSGTASVGSLEVEIEVELKSLARMEAMPDFDERRASLFTGTVESYAPGVMDKRRAKHQEKMEAKAAYIKELQSQVASPTRARDQELATTLPAVIFPLTEKMASTIKAEGFSTFGSKFHATKDSPNVAERRTLLTEEAWEAAETPDLTKLEKFRRVVQDLLLPIQRMEEHIESLGGNTEASPRTAAANQPGKIEARNVELDRAWRKIQGIMRKSGFWGGSSDEALHMAGEYLYAVAAPEVNALLRLRSADEGGGVEDGSGMTDGEAEEISERLGALEGMADIADIYRETVIEGTREQMLSGSIISQANLNYWRKTQPNYAPMRSADTDAELGTRGGPGGRGFQVSGPIVHKRKGRKTRAENPLVFGFTQASSYNNAAEKNRVGKALWDMVRDNQNLGKGLSYIELEPPAEPSEWEPKNAFGVWVNGKHKVIRLKDTNVNRAMKNLGYAPVHKILRAVGFVTRFMGQVVTTFNPNFMVPNSFRDLQTALVNITPEKIKGVRANGVRGVPAAMRAIADAGFRNKVTDSDMGRFYDEVYVPGGGLIGWSRDTTFEQRFLDMKRDLSRGAAARTFLGFLGAIQTTNSVIEMATRVSFAKALVDAGVETKRAVRAARELTVDFNRRGEITSGLSIYKMFINARIQGTAQMLININRDKKGMAAIGAGIAAFGFGMTMMNLIGMGDDDDGVPRYLKKATWKREKNIMFPNPLSENPDEMFTIPLTYGYNIFYVLGAQAAEAAFKANRGEDVSEMIGEATEAAIKTVWDGFSPISDGTILQALSPTALVPFVQTWENTNWNGAPIMPTGNPFDKAPPPDSERYFASASLLTQRVARQLNSWFGGNKYRAGTFLGMDASVSPETMEHLYESYLGGLAKMGENFTKLATQPWEDTGWDKVPVIRRFYSGDSSVWADRSAYYDTREQVYRADRELRGGIKLSARRRTYAALIGIAKSTDKQLGAIRKLEGDTDSAGKRRQALARQERLYKSFNRRFNAARIKRD